MWWAPRRTLGRPSALPTLPFLHPTPSRNEQRGRLGRFAQRVQINIFIKPVHRSTAGPKAQAWDIVIQPVKPRVSQRGEHQIGRLAAIDRIVSLAERGFWA